MKKLIAFAVVCGFAFALVACGAKEEKKDETTTPTEAPADTVKTDSTDTTKH